jgi:HPt (histidine-containing phosphotransfer) domain-containing protein
MIGKESETIIANGADDCLAKPFSIIALKQALANLHQVGDETSTPMPLIQTTESVDWERIDAIFDGDYQPLCEMFDITENDINHFLSQFKASGTVARDAAHALKGSCANLGLVALADIFSTIEKHVCQNEQVPTALFDAVENELITSRKDIEAIS